MRLSQSTVDLIMKLTNIGTILGIQGVILDTDGIRGYNDIEGVIIAVTQNLNFEFKELGLGRLMALKYKSNILNTNPFTVDAIPRVNTPDVIEKLVFDCGKVNFEYRCALPKSIKDIPTGKINFTPIFFFDITDEDVKTIVQSSSAMRSKNVTIQSKGGDVVFRFSDDSGDILNFKVDHKITATTDIDSVSLTLVIKKMAPIFKLAAQPGKFRLNILRNNIIHVIIDNIDVLVMPEV